ncbi:Arc family DNA-binding protein [Scandinavium manionii]|uniref:Arc family DNA-binding protein n=1 Tax=Scandinavium manionii TaxID=2926520 RepID=UPI002165357A|nr:Arc family DNA-binding protein [Scandinavium manionii]MCS2167537.1 Arc family DNA-binding protein [Scandinavium manionii]
MIVPSNSPKFNLRIPQEVKEALEKKAAHEGRSMNSEIMKRLMDSLKVEGIDFAHSQNSEAPTA